MGKVVRQRKRHLSIADAKPLPTTLGEYAGISNIESGLREKLGHDSLWLFAMEMYGILIRDNTVADFLGNTEGIAVPVRYKGLRELTSIEDTDEDEHTVVVMPAPHESVAVFQVNQFALHGEERILDSGNVITDYPEIAVRLGQAVTVLDEHEYQPDAPCWWRGKPYLRLVVSPHAEAE